MILAAQATDKGFTATLHRGFFTVVLLYALAMSLWGLFLFFRGRNPSGSYLGSLLIAEGVTAFQGLVGLILVLQGHRPHDGLHFLYGIVAVITLPAAYFLSAQGRERRDSLIFGLATLFLFGIAIRGATTGAT
ncbi:MAG: hypothetical protein NVSMB52_07760 [Chloroflexota bacterium]